MPDTLLFPLHYTVTFDGDQDGTALSVTVARMARRDESTALGRTVGIHVKLEIVADQAGAPATYFLSRLEGEVGWAIDAKFGPDGYPHYVHTFGERLSAARTVIKPVARILDDLARAQGLAENIGDQVPLVLAPHRQAPATLKPGASG